MCVCVSEKREREREKEYRSRIQITYSLLMTIGFLFCLPTLKELRGTGADPRLLERGSLCIKG